MIASLPMYDADRAAVAGLWMGIRAGLLNQGVEGAPESLAWPEDLDRHWLRSDLLLSQTCGYPIVDHLRDKVQLVGAFRHAVDGCDGIRYSSKLVVREDDPGRQIADFRGRTAAYNAVNSQSGYNALLALVAPLADDGRFFGRALASGAHARSIEMVRSRAADIAAVDCISLATLQRTRPESLDGLRVIGATGTAPGLPLITAASTPASTLALLRRAIADALTAPSLAEVRATLFLEGFEPVPVASYEYVAELRRHACALGCAAL